ncbi:MAG: hypothetical protein MJ138_00610 [Kiritimatiellae bacterium]|nr:hypothetical protein [Kiritimatiellia bacterium]
MARARVIAFSAALLGAAAAFCADVAVVTPADAYGTSLGNHVARWLKAQAIAADVVPAADLSAALQDRKLAFLVTPKGDAAQIAALKAFFARGGRAFVFYSTSAPLAAAMGFKLGVYKKPAAANAYSKIVLDGTGPRGAPREIIQSSANVYTASPVKGKSRVIATWLDRAGRDTGDAAILASNSGWWMTHVMLADGDEGAKARFLASVAGQCVPGSWSYEAFAAKRQKELNELRAYALEQKPRAGEIRATWDHSGQGLYPGDWPRTIRELKRWGITDLFVNVAGAGFAHYNSKVLPVSAVCTEQGDQLAACLKAAAGSGVRVHAWILCFNGTRSTPGRMAAFAQKGWRLKDKKGKLTEYLDPSNAELRQMLLDAVAEMASKYAVAGVHLDFVRWYEGSSLPADAASTIGGFVATARARLRAARRDAWLTAAVFGKYPSCVSSVGQDWESWLDGGFVDYVVPMNYLEDNAKYALFMAQQCRTPAHARKVISGIGVTANESRLSPRQVIDQVRVARKCGAAGVAFFDLDYVLVNDVLPYLRLGLFK